MTTPNSVAATTDPLSEAYITDVLADLERTSSTNAGAYEGDVARRVERWFDGTPIQVELIESQSRNQSSSPRVRRWLL